MTSQQSSADNKNNDADGPEVPDEAFAAAIRAQLQSILNSEALASSPRASRLLRFLVEHTLEARKEPLKEYVIGLAVFDKDESFDPQIDSIVRVEASRLRTKLRKYYEESGQGNPIHIELPKRGYVPVFLRADEGTAGRPTRDASQSTPSNEVPARTAFARGRLLPWYGLAAGVFALSVAVGFYFWRSVEPEAAQTTSDISGVEQQPVTWSVAVLPLKNLTEEGGEEYFSDAMTDALITSLAKVEPLRVTSTTSVMHYKDAKKSLPEIARELNVGHIVEGSVLRVGDRVRITAQLIEGKTDQHIWAESYERDTTDILALQRDVAWRIANVLSGEMLDSAEAKPKQPTAIDADAFEAYLKGQYFRNKLTAAGFSNGLNYFEQVIAKEPGYALAYTGLASCYCLLGGHGLELMLPSEGIPKAKAAALKALELDDELAEPYGVLGIIRTKYDWDWDGAEQAFRQSLQLNPSFAQGRAWYSLYLEAMARHPEAIAEAERARQLNPLSMGANVNLAWQLYQADRNEEAIEQLEKVLELDPGFWGAHWALGSVYRHKKMYPEAIAALQKAVALEGGQTLPVATLAYTYAVAGQHSDARELLDELLALSAQSYVSPAHIATVYAGLDDKDKAFEWLDKAYELRSRSLAWLNVAREWDSLRSDSRFAVLLEKVGLES